MSSKLMDAFQEFFRRTGPLGLCLLLMEFYVGIWFYFNRSYLNIEQLFMVLLLFLSFMFLEKLNRIDRALWKLEEKGGGR